MHYRLLGASLILTGAALSAPARPAQAQTNGFVLHCLSARAAGQACVTRAREGVPTNLFHDPASIVWFDRASFELNASAFTPSLTFRNSANPGVNDGALHSYPLVSTAIAGPSPIPRVAWAFGVEPIGGFGADFKLTHPVLGPRQNYESFFAALRSGPVLAWEPVDGFSLGAGANIVYAQIRDFRMPFAMTPQAATGFGALAQLDPQHYPGMFSGITELVAYGDSRDFSGWGVGASLGAAWRGAGLRASVSWSPRTKMTLDGATATIDMSRQFEILFGALVQERMTNHGETESLAQQAVARLLGTAGLDLSRGTVASYDASTDLATPQTAGVGVSFDPGDRWNIALEGSWMDWSAAESVMPFRLTDGDNPNINMLLNADPTNADFTYPFPLQWKDSWTAKAGVQFAAGANTMLRAGYLYGSNPVPDNTVFIAFPAISTRAVTAGAGFRVGTLPLEVSVVHALRARLNGCDHGHRISSEYVNSASTLSQTTVTFGAVWKF